jgi:hypothetical protein
MADLSIPCNRCGAVLHVAPSTNFATCARCGASLAVRRSGDAVYTEPAGEQALHQVAANLETIAHQNELARIDREWQIEREQYLIIFGRYGQQVPPSTGKSVLGGVIIVGFGILWTAFAFAITANAPIGGASIFPLFGVLFILAGIGTSVYSYNLAQRYEKAHAEYQRRRRDALNRHE